MKRRCFSTLVSLAAVTACSSPPVPVAGDVELEKLLPELSAAADWSLAEGPTLYTPETLYEYVNGGADRYLVHGFREVVHVRYQLGDDPLAGVTLDLYDMGSELGAFGFYSAGRTPSVDVRSWGAEGYRVGAVAATWRGSLFVHGEADDERPELVAVLERMMAEVGERAPGPRSQPAVLEPLPKEWRVARSERYLPADLLGHAFLPGGVLAAYEIEGDRGELYFSDLGSEHAATEALADLRQHHVEWGTVDDLQPPLGDEAFRYTDPTLGSGVAAKTGRYIAGIHGDLGVEAHTALMDQLLEALP